MGQRVDELGIDIGQCNLVCWLNNLKICGKLNNPRLQHLDILKSSLKYKVLLATQADYDKFIIICFDAEEEVITRFHLKYVY